MRGSGVNAAIARYRKAGIKNLRAIGIARNQVARIPGFYCVYINREKKKEKNMNKFNDTDTILMDKDNCMKLKRV